MYGFRVCGVEPDLRAVQLPITPGAQWSHDLASPPVREDVPSAGPTTVSPCEGLSLSRDVFESVLRDHATGYTQTSLRSGTLLESFQTSTMVCTRPWSSRPPAARATSEPDG